MNYVTRYISIVIFVYEQLIILWGQFPQSPGSAAYALPENISSTCVITVVNSNYSDNSDIACYITDC